MNKKNNIVCSILTVIAYFYGIMLIATIILIPVGIYSVIAANRYSSYSEMQEPELAMRRQSVLGWIIFGSILYFPLGLLLLLVLPSINNNVVVEDVQREIKVEEAEQPAESENQEPAEVEIHEPKTNQEKAEKLAKLERFKNNGLITEEEFEQAKKQLEENE